MMDTLQATGAIQFATVVEAKRAGLRGAAAPRTIAGTPMSAQSKRYQRTFKGKTGNPFPSATTKPQKPPRPIKSVQEGLDHSWDTLVIGQTFGTPLRTCKREAIP